MPCRDYDSDTPKRAEDFAHHFLHAGETAELLCSLMKNIESAKVEANADLSWIVPTNVALWWEQHKIRDKEKAAVEAAARKTKELRGKALAKLSVEEKLALGLKPFQKS
jgi:hypothetical protein